MYYVGSMAYDPNYLEHHGILGMKWGVRRYQNPDGSLTAAGKARYVQNPDGSIRKKKWSELDRKQKIIKSLKVAGIAAAGIAAGGYVGIKGLSALDIALNGDAMKRVVAGAKYIGMHQTLSTLNVSEDSLSVNAGKKIVDQLFGSGRVLLPVRTNVHVHDRFHDFDL